MKRINEADAAKTFVKQLIGGFYPNERSRNNEVVYKDVKEERDTQVVSAFVNSNLFKTLKDTLD